MATAQLRELLETLVKVESYTTTLERKGIDLEEYFAAQDDKGNLPVYRLKIEGETKLVLNDQELKKLTEEAESLAGSEVELTDDLFVEDRTVENEEEKQRIQADVTELYESHQIRKLALELRKRRLNIAKWYVPATPDSADGSDNEEREPVATMQVGDSVQIVYSLTELLEYVRGNGRKGLSIQRYKGLGEMNPEQLWETTMDPQRRTLMKVMIEDAIETDNIFTVLMGDEVKCRREFIDKHAKHVTNLDV
jgi:DNA gyrase subunit B